MRLPELVRYPAFDGRQIPAFLFPPEGWREGTLILFVVVPPRRPGRAEPVELSAGAAVIPCRAATARSCRTCAVRPVTAASSRCSTTAKLRWDSVRDGVDVAEWLVKELPRPARSGDVRRLVRRFPCRSRASSRTRSAWTPASARTGCSGVDVVGIVNMQTFLEKTSGYRRKLREVEYGLLTDPDFLRTVSSIHKVGTRCTPFFIAHRFQRPARCRSRRRCLRSRLATASSRRACSSRPTRGTGS